MSTANEEQQAVGDTVTRKEICALWQICASRLVNIIYNHRHLNFPAPLDTRVREVRYNTMAVLAWKVRNPLDQIRWRQPKRTKKPAGLDAGSVSKFMSGGYDPIDTQVEYLKLRYKARAATPVERVVVTTKDSGFIKDTNHMRGLL